MSAKKNSSRDKYRAVIIGAGRIGALFDTPKVREILTHAHAYRRNPRIDLTGFFDIHTAAAQKATRIWGGKAFKSMGEMFKKAQPDIVSICSPDIDHAKTLRKVLTYRPQLVICEKPVTQSARETKKIAHLYRHARIPVLVNYSRRFDPRMHVLRTELVRGEYGKILVAHGIYTKGLLHTGSHLIDLARYLFGEVKHAERIGEKMIDFHAADPTVSGYLTFARCPEFYLSRGDDRAYGIFELDIVTERARIRLTDFGFTMAVQRKKEDARYKGFFGLGPSAAQKTQLPQALAVLVDNAVDYLEGRAPLWCTIHEALKTQEACERLKK